jgi:hypothetical protein
MRGGLEMKKENFTQTRNSTETEKGKTNAINRIQPISEISSRYVKISETAVFVQIQPFWNVAVTPVTPLRYGPPKRRLKTAGFWAQKLLFLALGARFYLP